MIIVDRALEQRAAAATPIRVGMVGAGAMGRALARQICSAVPGMDVVAICNRTVDSAVRAYREAGRDEVLGVETAPALDAAIRRGQAAVTDDPSVLCESAAVDVLLEVTGAVEFASGVVVEAMRQGKHAVLMNAELEATLGPILRVIADRYDVVVSGCDGDQPGVEMNLFRGVRSLGFTPLVCGNIKGLHDRLRTPATQQAFADRWGLSARMATSFADGTKVSFEQAVVANATGMRVAKRGMLGRTFVGHVDELTREYDADSLRAWGGIVDYVVGAQPAPGVFVLATHEDPAQRTFMQLYKRGDGPLYSFYTPYHLCHFEVPLSVARVVLFRDPVTVPLGAPFVHVVATAKRDLRPGDRLDGIGGFDVYGQCDNATAAVERGLLPMGLADGCRMVRHVARDAVLTFADVALPAERTADRLWTEQLERFSPAAVA
ncbi:MAG: NAD(P)-dependent oxidoreductase [Candidatus Dormibacteraeota bacterium]|nr:NAD(P)-dependent oxidoreductase [Candidatus Dormibacteraeota bacterium]MBV9526276.1 NAD(P)-dependent oxidoreductase [Candidatus Dormibacteraeota bacterium]